MQHNRFNQADNQVQVNEAVNQSRRIQACDNPQGAFQQYQQQFTQPFFQQPSGMFTQNPIINNQPMMQNPILPASCGYHDIGIAKYSNTKIQSVANHLLGAHSVQRFIESKDFKVACRYTFSEVELVTVFTEEDGTKAELMLKFKYAKDFTPENVSVAYLNGKDNSDKNEVFAASNGYINRVIQYVNSLLKDKTPTLDVNYIHFGFTTNFFLREVTVKDGAKYLYLDTSLDNVYVSYELIILIKGKDVMLVVTDEYDGTVMLSCCVNYSNRNIAGVISTLESTVRTLTY